MSTTHPRSIRFHRIIAINMDYYRYFYFFYAISLHYILQRGLKSGKQVISANCNNMKLISLFQDWKKLQWGRTAVFSNDTLFNNAYFWQRMHILTFKTFSALPPALLHFDLCKRSAHTHSGKPFHQDHKLQHEFSQLTLPPVVNN